MSNIHGSRPENAHLVVSHQPPASSTASSSSSSSAMASGPTQTPREDLVREGKSQDGDAKSLESLNPQVVSAQEASSRVVQDIGTQMSVNFGVMTWAMGMEKTVHNEPKTLVALDAQARGMFGDLKKSGPDPQHVLSACLDQLKACREEVLQVPGAKAGKTDPERFRILSEIVLTQFNRAFPGQLSAEQLTKLLTAFPEPAEGLAIWLKMAGESLKEGSVMHGTLEVLVNKAGMSKNNQQWLASCLSMVAEQSLPKDVRTLVLDSGLRNLGIATQAAPEPTSLVEGQWSFMVGLAQITEQSAPEVAGRLWQCAGAALGDILKAGGERALALASQSFFKVLVDRPALFLGAGLPGPARDRVIAAVKGWRDGLEQSYASLGKKLPADFRTKLHGASLQVTDPLVSAAQGPLSTRPTEQAAQVAPSNIARLFKSQIAPPPTGAWGDLKSKS